MSEKIKIGVVGCGCMAQWAHLPCLRVLSDVDLTALYDPRQELARRIKAKWEIGETAPSLNALLEMPIDAVYVLTPLQCHRDQIIRALAAGKHVFTEKPLAMSADSAREIAKAAKRAGKIVHVGYMKQHDANIAAALAWTREHPMGQLQYARAHAFIGSYWHARVDLLNPLMTSEEPLPALDPAWLDPGPQWLDVPRDEVFYSFDNPYYALLDTGCHSVNLLRFLTGRDPDLIAVHQKAGARVMALDFQDCVGTVEFRVNFQTRKWDEVTELFYEKGSIAIYTPQPTSSQASARVEIYHEEGESCLDRVYENNHEWAFARQAKHFVEAIRENDVSPKPIEDSVKDLETIERVYQWD